MKRFLAVLGAAGVLVLSAAPPAQAVEPEPHYAAGKWQLRDWPGVYPSITPTAATESEKSCDEVVLAKPAGDVGTSYENTNLDLPVQDGDVLKVDYVLSDLDVTAAGAVRLFAYKTADADTLFDGPTFGFVAAGDADVSGTLTLPLSPDGAIGTAGLTYDASNATTGYVTFSNLRLETPGEEPVVMLISFCPKPVETPTTTSTAILPVTGDSFPVFTVVVVSVGLLIAGAGLLIGLRRRREREASPVEWDDYRD